MSDWIVCNTCDLKHRPRPDGACPRCGEMRGGRPPLARMVLDNGSYTLGWIVGGLMVVLCIVGARMASRAPDA